MVVGLDLRVDSSQGSCEYLRLGHDLGLEHECGSYLVLDAGAGYALGLRDASDLRVGVALNVRSNLRVSLRLRLKLGFLSGLKFDRRLRAELRLGRLLRMILG